MNEGAGVFLKNVIIEDNFWSRIRETARINGLPYQWAALNDQVPDAAPSYCMRNFLAAAGKIQAPHGGFMFQDSDVAKWLEAVAYSLQWHPDQELEATADEAIDMIVAAQQPDGYLDTYYILTGLDKRWTELMNQHELYCAGHLIEAAVAYYETTGKRKLLDAVIRFVKHIDSVIGPDEGKKPGYPGHPLIEMALMKLYKVTQNKDHLRLAEYFIRQRGQAPLYFEREISENHVRCEWLKSPLKLGYYQAHKPLTEQQDAVGHAVRALYLYSGLADVAHETGSSDLLETCYRLWKSIINKRMYITGAVGSSNHGEAFTFDYDLPNDTAYGETCASIALVFLAQRMLKLQPNSEYADIMERTLYNGVLSGMQLDGKKFFYVNPLEVVPEACEKDARKRHVRPERQKWFGCACCPPNIIRLLMSLQQYVCSATEDTLYMHLFIGGAASTVLGNQEVGVCTRTNYPWNGDVYYTLKMDHPSAFTFAIRIPDWCSEYTLLINGQPAKAELEQGYAKVQREWKDGDTVCLSMEMCVKLYRANAKVRENIGQLAVCRGPIVYCMEEVDNGHDLHLLRLGHQDLSWFKAAYEPELLSGVVTLTAPGRRMKADDENLYTDALCALEEDVSLRWVPYFAWCNRTPGEMRVWIRQ